MVKNLNKKYRLNEKFLDNIISEILKYIKKDIEVEVVLLNDSAIKKINKKYLNKNRSTDVISFRIDRREFGNIKDLGEIFISADTAWKNSKIYGMSFEDEIVLYLIHGILHLFGYDDMTAGEKLSMSKKETEILDYICTKEDLSRVLTRR